MKQHSFEKFINKETNSKKKEAIRQEKRKWKKERNAKYEAEKNKSETRNPKFQNPKKIEIKPGTCGRQPITNNR